MISLFYLFSDGISYGTGIDSPSDRAHPHGEREEMEGEGKMGKLYPELQSNFFLLSHSHGDRSAVHPRAHESSLA